MRGLLLLLAGAVLLTGTQEPPPAAKAAPLPPPRSHYLGREIALDARSHDLKGASDHLAKLQAAWKALRAKVMGAKGRRTALAYDLDLRFMAKALKAGQATVLRAAAERSLEDVDRIERVFGG